MNKIIILVFLLVVLSLVYLNFKKISDNFESNSLKLELIDSKKASEVIRNVKSFNKYNSLDKSLRKISRNKNIYSHYIKNLVNWNNTDIKLFSWLREGLLSMTPKKYQFLYDDVLVAKYKDDIEMGFPHTHDNTIFLTSLFIREILPFFTNNDIEGCIKRVGSVIIHETIHIWQRRDPNFFLDLYESWNFTKYNKIYNFSKLRNKNRYNPDGVSLYWGWKLPNTDIEIVPMAVYSKGASNISHVNLIGIRLEKVGRIPIIPPILDFTNLRDISEYQLLFGNLGGNDYHPNELSAEIISRIITKKALKIFNDDKLSVAEKKYIELISK